MGFGQGSDIGEGGVRKFYTGVENFKVVAVNPSKDDLEILFGREISYEPEYIGTQTVKDGAGEREVPQVKFDFYLNNDDAETPIATKVTFYVTNTFHQSQTGKLKVINDFGKTTWLEKEHIKAKTVPSSMTWYNTSGLKVAKRGEEELVGFIANLLNIPFDLTKVNDISEAHAKFDKAHWDEMLKGNFDYVRGAVLSSNNKIGLALGVKVLDDQSLRQAIFNKKSLRQYVLAGSKPNKFQYLIKAVDEAKANGAYGTTNFGPDDYVLREFSLTPTAMTSSNMPPAEDVFGQAPQGDGSEDWLNDGGGDDLPF